MPSFIPAIDMKPAPVRLVQLPANKYPQGSEESGGPQRGRIKRKGATQPAKPQEEGIRAGIDLEWQA
jgi:hypothetical protein